MKQLSARRIAFAGLLAAVYAVLTHATGFMAYGPFQFRIAEALMVFCCFTPVAVPGLTLGCLAANLLSTVGPWDMFLGTLATLLACLLTRRIRTPWLACLPTVLCNAVIVGAELAYFMPDGRALLPAFGFYAFTVGAGEAAVMYLLGLPLLLFLRRSRSLCSLLAGL